MIGFGFESFPSSLSGYFSIGLTWKCHFVFGVQICLSSTVLVSNASKGNSNVGGGYVFFYFVKLCVLQYGTSANDSSPLVVVCPSLFELAFGSVYTLWAG